MAIELVAALAAATAVRARHEHSIRKATVAWRAYAESRGLVYQTGRVGWAHRQWPRVEGTLDGVHVAIDGAVHPTDMDYSTAFIAIPASPRPGDLEVTREGLVAKFAKLLGAQDLVLGDEPFDGAYLVKATNEAAAREALGPDVRREILALNAERLVWDDGSKEGHDPMIVLEISGVIEAGETIDRALRLVARLASPGIAAVR